MKTVLVWVLTVAWVAAVVALSGWVWVRSRRAGLDEKRADARRRTARDRQRSERDLERVVREATLAGAVVAVARRGAEPTRVTWSDGSVWFYYRDDDAYRQATARGMAPAGTTHRGEAPALGEPRPAP